VITHFGATILEAMVYRKPMVIVPNPEWTRTAGVEDAECYARKINAVMISEIALKNLLGAIEEARGREYPELPDGSANLANLILTLG
jgi:UDP-N-acetylglucosamine:LPS N-acetylglucosamine transferase